MLQLSTSSWFLHDVQHQAYSRHEGFPSQSTTQKELLKERSQCAGTGVRVWSTCLCNLFVSPITAGVQLHRCNTHLVMNSLDQTAWSIFFRAKYRARNFYSKWRLLLCRREVFASKPLALSYDFIVGTCQRCPFLKVSFDLLYHKAQVPVQLHCNLDLIQNLLLLWYLSGYSVNGLEKHSQMWYMLPPKSWRPPKCEAFL